MTSNNYAEYTAIILGQLVTALFGVGEARFRCDSQLVVQQVKGLYRTKNVRLVELIKICHHLTGKFDSI
jgi:ribonuclease HI